MNHLLPGKPLLKKAVVVSLLFGAGWACNAATNRFASASSGGNGPLLTTAESGACVDRAAMDANANLVGQLHDVRGRLTHADEIDQLTRAADAVGKSSLSQSGNLTTSHDSWSRMAQERAVRVRTPCSNWSETGGFRIVQGHAGIRIGTTSRTAEIRQRASLANFGDAELETLSQAYSRAHARTWAQMKSVCEANAAYKESFVEATTPTPPSSGDDVDRPSSEEREPEAPAEKPPPPTDEERISMCRYAFLNLTTDSSRAAVTRVAELRAANAGIDRTNTDEQRVLHALTTSTAFLEEEMVKALGKEATTRALDHGVVCTHETVFDVREAKPPVAEIKTLEEPSEPEG